MEFFKLKLVILLYLAVGMTPTGRAGTVMVGPEDNVVPLGSYLHYLEDPSGNFTLNEVMRPNMVSEFSENNSDNPSFGYSKSSYWFKVTIDSNLTNKEDYFIELNYPLLDHIKLSYIIIVYD